MPLPATLTHEAMFYGSDEEFVAALAPFTREGLERGEAVAAAVIRTNIDLLRDALGADARATSFIDRDEWYRRGSRADAAGHRPPGGPAGHQRPRCRQLCAALAVTRSGGSTVVRFAVTMLKDAPAA